MYLIIVKGIHYTYLLYDICVQERNQYISNSRTVKNTCIPCFHTDMFPILAFLTGSVYTQISKTLP